MVHIHKKSTDKASYRTTSARHFLSKVFEKVIDMQIYYYTEKIFNQILCGFRKAYSTRHVLYRLLLLWQKALESLYRK